MWPLCPEWLSLKAILGWAEGWVCTDGGRPHALLAKSIEFNNLGLLIIDEEQNFGVAQKERLKELRVISMCSPCQRHQIPRTLQLLHVRGAQYVYHRHPPVDELAVRTFVGGWDGVVLKEAILRERFRGGQTFMVCPRISASQPHL